MHVYFQFFFHVKTVLFCSYSDSSRCLQGTGGWETYIPRYEQLLVPPFWPHPSRFLRALCGPCMFTARKAEICPTLLISASTFCCTPSEPCDPQLAELLHLFIHFHCTTVILPKARTSRNLYTTPGKWRWGTKKRRPKTHKFRISEIRT